MCEKDISWKQRLISYIIAYVIAIYPLHPAWSLAITPSDKTIKVNQQNTVPIINISTPNNLGISHNKFHSFNVSKQGVVLNNATTSVNTQLAKQVNANTHLKGSAAHLIINEVVGNGRSQLQGKLEVAGEQAKVVIANPNGITCDGCSFINTPAITLTTGKPLFNPQGAYSAIEVKKGGVVIGTQGIDLQTQDYADIISRSIELNGKINAKTLSLMQGNNRIDFDKGTVNSINGEGVKPTLSIDTKVLGGMYANQIRLVSTEKGVGVNLSNIQTNQNSVNLTVDGKITFNGNIQSDQDINVSSKELQINSNTKLKAKRDITLATNTLINHSEVISEKDMRLFADKLTNKNEKALIQAKDNLWIQRNAQGDPSSLIENQSATIKTEKGDLIIRTKKLVNTSLSDLPIISSIEANSTAKRSFVASYWGNSQGVVSINTYYPELENFPYKKWFGYLDLTSTDVINTERYKYKYSNSIGYIDSGKNIYIKANELVNKLGVIRSNKNTILTGSNAVISNLGSGELNLWYKYKTAYDHLGVYADEEDDEDNYDILYVREPLKFELVNKFYSWLPNRNNS
ncbi:filamentous hemagglutinin N-terminal domain-containing protein [Proteus terrae]|nr:filamentous hemagglutinin N-terminal domain-containing protein [Proteus terrae]